MIGSVPAFFIFFFTWTLAFSFGLFFFRASIIARRLFWGLLCIKICWWYALRRMFKINQWWLRLVVWFEVSIWKHLIVRPVLFIKVYYWVADCETLTPRRNFLTLKCSSLGLGLEAIIKGVIIAVVLKAIDQVFNRIFSFNLSLNIWVQKVVDHLITII